MLFTFKLQKSRINYKNHEFLSHSIVFRRNILPRSYLGLKIIPGEVYTLSTKKLLGSAIRIQPKENSLNQYFQISSAKVRADETGTGGLNLKSGDIIGLEKSFAEFLSVIYTRQNQGN